MKKMRLEKGVLAIAIILLCVSTLKAVNSAEPAEKVALNAKLSEIQAVLNSSNKPELPKIDYLERLQRAWMTLPEVPEMSDGFMFKNTIHTIAYQETPKPPLPVILPPCLNAIKVNPGEPDKMVVSWVAGKSTAQVTGYKLYRKAQDEQGYKLLAELLPNTTTYTDVAIQPETTYEYYITSLTNDKGEGGDKPESAPSVKVNATTEEVAYPDCESGVSYNNLTGNFIVVIKNLSSGGKISSSYQYEVKQGDKIGQTNYSLSKVEDFIDTGAGYSREYKKLTFKNSRTNKIREAKVRVYK
jgi:hypothetical protein